MARSVVDQVYTARPADFIRTRNAVVKELAGSGRVEEAEAIRRLRKPTVPVWALNQLARQEPAVVGAFVKAVQELGKAQQTGTRVAEAIRAEREARQHVIARAEALAATTGVRTTADTTRRIANTLLGAATDDGARGRLVRGELHAELRPSGFDLFQGATLRAVRKPDTSRRLEMVSVERNARELERIAREHRDTAAEAARKRAGLERELRALTTGARDEERAARGADARADEARKKLRVLQGRRGRSSRPR